MADENTGEDVSGKINGRLDGWGGHSELAPHVEREVVPASGGGGEKNG